LRRVDHAELVDLAASVADGTPIDWSQAEARTDGDSRRLVSHLRLVERIASLHRSIPDDNAVTGIAAAVADRGTIDWDAIEAGAHGKDRRLLRHLRLVESISSVHRTMALEERTQEAGLTAPAESEQPSGPRWGQLVLLDSIGQGASSEVFRAWDSTLHQEVALKLLHDDGTSADTHGRLLDEARRLARVHHRHVVHVYGADEHDDRVGLWMELVRGHSLEEIVKTRGSFGEREAALIGLDLCAALAAVHRAGLLHRDIKAQNVMREDGGRIVLMDFGTGEELAGTSRLVGTPLYLAPEIFRGEKASAQTDIYSAGVLLYYLVTGQFPVSAASMQELARAHADRQRRPVRDLRPDLHESFVRVIERSLDSDPKRRYASAGELEAALRETIAPQTLPIPQPQPLVATVPVSTPVPLRRRSMMAYGVALLVAVVSAVALIVWTRLAELRRGTDVTTVRTIAVLPMNAAAGGSVPPHYAAALTDELLATLGQVSALTLKAAPSIGPSAPSKELASQLDVDALLVTTLLEGENQGTAAPPLKVNARLHAAGNQAIVWSRTFERPRGATLLLQADIARAVAEAVHVALPPNESKRLETVRQTNPAAEEAYLLGRMNQSRYGAGSAEQALKAFRRAIELDPNHAKAYAGAAWANITLGQNNRIPNEEAHAIALADVQRALTLDANLADAHATLGYIAFLYDWDWKAAETSFRRSLALNPNSVFPRILYANYLVALRRFDEAIEQSATANRLELQAANAARAYGLMLYYKRDYAAAERAIAHATRMDPSAAGGPLLQSRVDEAFGRFDRALELTNQAIKLSAGGSVALRISAIGLEAQAGHRADAEAKLGALQREVEARGSRLAARDLAYLQLAFGNHDAALDLFAQSVDDRDPSVVWIGVDPRLDPLRGDPRYRQLLARIGLPREP
jgi:tetratricopeptide (TPR) repeat protein/tRNA A-37 threonylcarbamoyl transferase component Bud32